MDACGPGLTAQLPAPATMRAMTIVLNPIPILLWVFALIMGGLIAGVLMSDGLNDEWGNPGRRGIKLPPKLLMWLAVGLSALAVLLAMYK